MVVEDIIKNHVQRLPENCCFVEMNLAVAGMKERVLSNSDANISGNYIEVMFGIGSLNNSFKSPDFLAKGNTEFYISSILSCIKKIKENLDIIYEKDNSLAAECMMLYAWLSRLETKQIEFRNALEINSSSDC